MTEQPMLHMEGVRKTFGNVVALDDVSLKIKKREIHGLLGGNGAGKTTLMNILYGLYKPNTGQIYLDGNSVEIQSPRDAIKHGIGMVHQHFLQVTSFSVLENIVLGTPMKNRPTMNLDDAEKKVLALSKQFGLDVDPHALVEDLTMGARQKIEILKVLYRGAKILILDEPTTSLTPQEVDTLFESLKIMVSQGMSVVFITHKLREVLSVCDQITVLRKGKSILTLQRDAASEEAFVTAMVGEDLDIEESLIFADNDAPRKAPAFDQPPLLSVKDLSVLEDNVPTLNACSFEIFKHEILGVAGVAGNGQRTLAETLINIQTQSAGTVHINGVNLANMKTADLLDDLVSYIPEDRLQDGFLPGANVAQNLILGSQRRSPYSKNGFLDWKRIFQSSRDLIAEYNILTSGPDDVGANLSGGNIQRVMIARAFSYPSKLLIAHNPTQGLDIPSMEFVYSKLLERKETGHATLLMSENLDELLLVCDRIATIYRGKIIGVLDRNAFDKYEIGRLMSGIATNA